MGIVIILVVMLFIGTALLVRDNCSIWGIILSVTGGVLLASAIIALPVIATENNNFVYKYQILINYTESLSREEHVSPQERSLIATEYMAMNRLIMEHKKMSDNFFVNWFYSDKIANLELFDFADIPEVEEK